MTAVAAMTDIAIATSIVHVFVAITATVPVVKQLCVVMNTPWFRYACPAFTAIPREILGCMPRCAVTWF